MGVNWKREKGRESTEGWRRGVGRGFFSSIKF